MTVELVLPVDVAADLLEPADHGLAAVRDARDPVRVVGAACVMVRGRGRAR